MSTIAKDDSAEERPPKLDPEKMRLWDMTDVGGWIKSRWGIVGSQFEAAEGIGELLDRFEAGIKLVEREFSVDFGEWLDDWIISVLSGEADEDKAKENREKLHERLREEEKDLSNVGRLVDAWDLYQWVNYTRANIAAEDAPSAAWTAALAAQAAIRLKGRTVESLLESGYKHSYVAPAKKTGWHADLVKAAERLRKNGIRANKIVGKLLAQFPDRSRSTIYRVLNEKEFFE